MTEFVSKERYEEIKGMSNVAPLLYLYYVMNGGTIATGQEFEMYFGQWMQMNPQLSFRRIIESTVIAIDTFYQQQEYNS